MTTTNPVKWYDENDAKGHHFDNVDKWMVTISTSAINDVLNCTDYIMPLSIDAPKTQSLHGKFPSNFFNKLHLEI